MPELLSTQKMAAKKPAAAQSGEPRADGGHQRQVGELRGEDDDLEGQRVQSEEAEARP